MQRISLRNRLSVDSNVKSYSLACTLNLLSFLIFFANVSYAQGANYAREPELFYKDLSNSCKPDTSGLRDANYCYKSLLTQLKFDSIKQQWLSGISLKYGLEKLDSLLDKNIYYKWRLEQFKSDSIKQQWLRDFPFKPYLTTILGNILRNNEYIDSVTAVNVAVLTAARYYGSRITLLGARAMGNNEEHWLVYCFPILQSDIQKQEKLYREAVRFYKTGKLFCKSIIGSSLKVAVVLISRENGQVLAMIEM
jgi:hypothetical protein